MQPNLDTIMVRSRLSERQIVVGTAPKQIADGLATRCSLSVSVPAGQILTISTSPNVTNGNGITVSALGGSVSFILSQDGGLVYGPWYACTDANTLTVTVVEANSDAT